MYGLPKDFNGDFFVGRTLTDVDFAEYNIGLIFDQKVSINILGSLLHQIGPNDHQSVIQTIPLTESKLMQLPGRAVVRVMGDAEGTLTLVFDNGHVLKIFDDQPNYESYSYNDGQKEYYV